MSDFAYTPPGAVARAFMLSRAFVRGLRGPVGSGKSTACIAEIFRTATDQEPNADGIRKTRAIAIRNTGPELKTTTIKSWLDIFPEHKWGKFNWSPPFTHRIRKLLPDKTILDLEMIFIALDRPEDVKKLLSLEATVIWVNEAREVPKAIIDGTTMRVGRFPSMREGGPTFYGVIMDTNAPDVDHWWPILAGEAPIPDYIPREEALMLAKPDNWEFFCQPPGMVERFGEKNVIAGYEVNPGAENIRNLTPDYYPNMIRGKTKSWIDIYAMNRLGREDTGKPVHPSYRADIHLAKEPIPWEPDLDLWVGIDFGLTPAAIFGQRDAWGRWRIIHELVTSDMGAERFGRLLKSEIATKFPKARVKLYGDPAGSGRAQTDERTPFMVMQAVGLSVLPTDTNDPDVRIEAVDSVLCRMIEGMPAYMLSPTCTVLARAMDGGYQYRRLNTGGQELRYDSQPLKNRFSHPADAQQYLLLGAGEGTRVLTGTSNIPKPVIAGRPRNLLERRGGIVDSKSRVSRL